MKENRAERRRRQRKSEKIGKYRNAVIGLTTAVTILSLTTLGLGVMYGITQSKADAYGTQLESVYQQNYYDLVDNVNNLDTDISKLVNSDNPTYQKKLLLSLSSSAKGMQNN